MNITKVYTKTMHKALQNAIRHNNRLDYKPQGELIKAIWNTKQGITIAFNTVLCCRSGIDAKYFLQLDYNSLINDLQECYNKSITNNLYQLRSEFYNHYKLKSFRNEV